MITDELANHSALTSVQGFKTLRLKIRINQSVCVGQSSDGSTANIDLNVGSPEALSSAVHAVGLPMLLMSITLSFKNFAFDYVTILPGRKPVCTRIDGQL